MALICVSLMISGGKHFFICLLPTCMFSLEKRLFRSLAQFLLQIVCLFVCLFMMLGCMSCMDILDINPLTTISFANMFSHSVECLFVLWMVSFVIQKLLKSN